MVVFRDWDNSHFNRCANVEITKFYSIVKKGVSFNLVVIYVLIQAANAIPEFRYRIREEKVIEHKVVHPSFQFCSMTYAEKNLEIYGIGNPKDSPGSKAPQVDGRRSRKGELVVYDSNPLGLIHKFYALA